MMDIPLNEIDWSVVLVLRMLIVVSVMVFLLQMSIMLSHYWWRIMPLRQEMDDLDRRLVAPPVGWTFTYHLLVTIILGIVGIGIVQAAYHESQATVFSYIGAPLILTLTFVVNRFTKYYSQVLNDRYRDRFRQKR